LSRDVTFAYPGDLSLKTGGYGYDRNVIQGLTAAGWHVSLLPLGEGFPFPSEARLKAASELLSALTDGALVVIDGLAFGVLDAWASQHATRLRIVALVHHPLALETGISETAQTAFRKSERAALACARHVIVTSPMTARELAKTYDVNPVDITIAVPGTERVTAAERSNVMPQILSVGTLSQRKGHDVLLAALKAVEDLEWEAAIIGSKTLDPVTSQALEHQLDALQLGARVQLLGEVGDTRSHFSKADVFALASRYEGYGMVFAEALAAGLPIIACHAGAVPEVVPDDAGILVAVDDVPAFADALRRLLKDPAEREARAAASRAAGALLPTWNDTTQIISDALDTIS